MAGALAGGLRWAASIAATGDAAVLGPPQAPAAAPPQLQEVSHQVVLLGFNVVPARLAFSAPVLFSPFYMKNSMM